MAGIIYECCHTLLAPKFLEGGKEKFVLFCFDLKKNSHSGRNETLVENSKPEI